MSPPTAKTAESWSQILLSAAERLGVSAVVLAIIFFFLYKGGIWTGEHILKPITAKHIETMAVIQANTERQSSLLMALQQIVVEDHEHGEERSKLLKDILDAQLRTTKAIESMAKQ